MLRAVPAVLSVKQIRLAQVNKIQANAATFDQIPSGDGAIATVPKTCPFHDSEKPIAGAGRNRA